MLLLTIHHLVDARLVDASTRRELSDVIGHITVTGDGIGCYCSKYVLFICALLSIYFSKRTISICILVIIIVRGACADSGLDL